MKKLVLSLVAAIVLLGNSQAFAFDLGGYTGGIQVNFFGYSLSDLHIGDGASQDQADGIQDSWGVGFVESIYVEEGTTNLWNNGDGGEELVYFLRGIDDDDFDPALNQFDTGFILSNGGILDLYLQSSPTLDFDATNYSANGAGAEDDSYASITDTGVLFARFYLVPGIIPTDGETTMAETTFFGGVPFFGVGAALGELDQTAGGTSGGLFESDRFLNGADVSLSFTARIPSQNPGNGFNVAIDDPAILTATVPEPASMMLLGSGLMGMVGLRRKKS